MDRKKYERQLNELKGKDVVIFGYGYLGKIAVETLDCLGIKVAAIVDSNKNKRDEMINGAIPIMSPEQAQNMCEFHPIIICVFSEDAQKNIGAKLREDGWKHIIDGDFVVYHYLSKGIKKNGVRVLTDKVTGQEKIAVEGKLTLIITEKCSLKCRYCSHFIPYRKNPVHFSAQDCIDAVKNMALFSDRINELSIYGGEGLLHPALPRICEEIQAIDNIRAINILTNGTIIPSDELWRLWSKSGNYNVTVDSYGIHNNKIAELKLLCREHGIPCTILKIVREGAWVKCRPGVKHGRSEAENRVIYTTCTGPEKYPVIVDGKFYKCVASYTFGRMGFITEEEHEQNGFPLLNINSPEEAAQRKEELKRFLNSTESLRACDYCHTGPQVKIDAGDQIDDGDFSMETLRRYLED